MTAPDPTPDTRWRLAFNDRLRRIVVLILVAVASALLVVEFSGPPPRAYAVGEVADRDIFARRSFEYVDTAETNALRREAEDAVELGREPMRLIQGEELERAALGVEQPLLHLCRTYRRALGTWQPLQASVVLEVETLQVSRAILDSARLITLDAR